MGINHSDKSLDPLRTYYIKSLKGLGFVGRDYEERVTLLPLAQDLWQDEGGPGEAAESAGN